MHPLLRRFTLILPVMVLLLAPAPGQVRHPSYEGIAVDLETGEKVYIEYHKEILEDGRRVGMTSEYRDMNGNILALRSVDFRKNPFVPEFTLEDKRDGYSEGAEVVGDSVRLFMKKDRNSGIAETTLLIPEPAVIDAGFNNYVQARWESIARGEKQYFNFGAPFAQDYYGFRVYKEEEVEKNGRRMMVVHLDIDNFLIRLFLDPIVLMYDMEAKRLVSYEGISNINNDQGKSYVVRITYDPYGP